MFLTAYYDPNAPNETKACYTPPLTYSYNLYETTLNAGSGCVSVAINICVFIAYHRAMRQITSSILTNEQRVLVQQRRLTVTLGIMAVSTLIFYIIPFTVLAVYAWMNVVPPNVTLLFLPVRCSTIINVVIYVTRQKEMRSAMWALLTCRKAKSTWTNRSTRNPSTVR